MEEILTKIRLKNISINVDDGRLKLNIPKDVDATDILEEVKSNKEELISYITNRRNVSLRTKDINKTTGKPHYLLSSAQRRLYFLYEFNKDSVSYNIPQTFKF